ncbi:MAG: ArnT family glycosyltransferase [Planctomycetota bacterium]
MKRLYPWQRRIPMVLFFVATGLYLATMQRMLFGDGIFFDEMLQRGSLMNHHLLQLPLVWSLWAGLSVFADVSHETAMKVLSALTGGFGVAMTYLVARRILDSTAQALVAAITLMVVIGYWFHSTATELHALHAACAVVLLLGLTRAITAEQRLDKTTLTCCAIGTLLTPMSHLSGFAMGLPIVYVIWKIRSQLRRQLVMAVGSGFLVFAVIFGVSYWLSRQVRGSWSVASDISTTGISMRAIFNMLGQFLLYAVPVSPLVPAGLRLLSRTAPRQALLCLLWVISWPIAVAPHPDFSFGSYHTPTFPVQAILAVVALQGLTRTPLRAVAAMVLAALPMVGPVTVNLDLGLWVWVFAAAILFEMAGEPVSRPRWLPILPVTTLLLAAPYLIPKLSADPYRDRIREVSRLVAPADLVFYMPEDTNERNHWRRFFRADNKERAHCPADVDFLPANRRDEAPTRLKAYRNAMATAWLNDCRVWFVGKADGYEGSAEVMKFFADLHRTARFVREEQVETLVHELLPPK